MLQKLPPYFDLTGRVASVGFRAVRISSVDRNNVHVRVAATFHRRIADQLPAERHSRAVRWQRAASEGRGLAGRQQTVFLQNVQRVGHANVVADHERVQQTGGYSAALRCW